MELIAGASSCRRVSPHCSLDLCRGMGTTWGLFRHYWIVAKLLITVFATILLVVHIATGRPHRRHRRRGNVIQWRSAGAANPTDCRCRSCCAGFARGHSAVGFQTMGHDRIRTEADGDGGKHGHCLFTRANQHRAALGESFLDCCRPARAAIRDPAPDGKCSWWPHWARTLSCPWYCRAGGCSRTT
jgi:hypothetical protein